MAANKLKRQTLCIDGVTFRSVFDKNDLAFMAIPWFLFLFGDRSDHQMP